MTKQTKTAETPKATPPFLVAIDDGYAQVKLVGDAAEGEKRFMMRSSVRTGKYGGVFTLAGSKGFGSYVTEEGEDFTVSQEVESENTQFDSFHVSPMNRVLINHALLAAGYGGTEVVLATGLPVSDFFFDGGRDDEKIEAKRANLLKKVINSATGGIEPARITKVHVGCQAIAAFVDYLLDDNLDHRDVPSDVVAVVDVGGRTTDIAVILGGQQLDAARSGTENIGVLDVYKALGQAIRTRFKVRDKFPLATLDEIVRSGEVTLWNEKHDIASDLATVVQEQELKIAREVERKLGAAANVQKVLFVGGGAALFTNIASHFRNGLIAEDPEFANARGLHKYFRVYKD